MLSEIILTEKNTYHVISLESGLWSVKNVHQGPNMTTKVVEQRVTANKPS